MFMNPEQYFSFLRENAVRITPIMTATITFLYTSKKFHTPQYLQKELSARLGYGVGFPTLYRILDRLLSLNIIVPMFSKQIKTAYYLCSSPANPHHHHHVCTKCNRIQEIDYCTSKNFSEYINIKLGATMTTHIMQFEGVCATCL
jgi:Fur family transcriptional regulator, ferric uptake regulator